MSRSKGGHNRVSLRLKDYDYSQEGAYFITICVKNRQCLLGNVEDGKMFLNHAGEMVKSVWITIPDRFNHVVLDEFVVMPNHVHGILTICRGESRIRPSMGDHKDRPYGTTPNTIGRIIQSFKSITTNMYAVGVRKQNWPPFSGRLWQRNYYEHIIRDENELEEIREYILYNPIRWSEDKENPDNMKK